MLWGYKEKPEPEQVEAAGPCKAKFKLNLSFPNPPHQADNPVTHSGCRKIYPRIRETKHLLGALSPNRKNSHLSSTPPEAPTLLSFLNPDLESSRYCKGHFHSATAAIPCLFWGESCWELPVNLHVPTMALLHLPSLQPH